jgi:hypothetical protein
MQGKALTAGPSPIQIFLLEKRRDIVRVIRKVRKTQHQNPELVHTQGEIKKKTPANK